MSEGFPRWAAQEIASAAWQYHDTWEGSGYILDLYRAERRVDVQFYERLPEGRYIATLDVPQGVDLNGLLIGKPYLFQFRVYRAALSERLRSFLGSRYSVAMDALYRFELGAFQALEE